MILYPTPETWVKLTLAQQELIELILFSPKLGSRYAPMLYPSNN